MFGIAPDANIIDISHQVPRFSVREGGGTDLLLLGGFVVLFVVVTALAFSGASRLYVLPFLVQLAGG